MLSLKGACLPGKYTFQYSVISSDGIKKATASRTVIVYQTATVHGSFPIYKSLPNAALADAKAQSINNRTTTGLTEAVVGIKMASGSAGAAVSGVDVVIGEAEVLVDGFSNFTVFANATIHLFFPKGVRRTDITRAAAAVQGGGARHLLQQPWQVDEGSQETSTGANMSAPFHIGLSKLRGGAGTSDSGCGVLCGPLNSHGDILLADADAADMFQASCFCRVCQSRNAHSSDGILDLDQGATAATLPKTVVVLREAGSLLRRFWVDSSTPVAQRFQFLSRPSELVYEPAQLCPKGKAMALSSSSRTNLQCTQQVPAAYHKRNRGLLATSITDSLEAVTLAANSSGAVGMGTTAEGTAEVDVIAV
jgi:hypothetical protein